jgi:hypothetical protein
MRLKYAAVRDPVIEKLFGHIDYLEDFATRLMADRQRLERELAEFRSSEETSRLSCFSSENAKDRKLDEKH